MGNYPLFIISFILGIYGLITLIATPFQYLYVKSLVKMKNDSKGDIVDAVGISDISIHMNSFGNILFLPVTLLAMAIYKKKHKENIID